MFLAVDLIAQGTELDAILFPDEVSDNSSVFINFLIPKAIIIGIILGIKKLK